MPGDLSQFSSVCQDEHRLAALHRYDVLDTPVERPFEDITRLAAYICQTPIAIISLIDRERQWFKSEIGLGVRETPLDVSICAHALLQNNIFIVPDTRQDDRFKNNPLVTGAPYLRFYAGAVLQTPEGIALGTLCVLDYVPRDLDASQQDALGALARQVMAQLELRRALAAAIEDEEKLRRAKESAESANRLKDRHLAFLSHELRTPLNPALLTATAMSADQTLSHDARADAGIIRRNIELATRLADDLLDINRIASGKLELRCEDVNINELLNSSISMCEAEALARYIELKLEFLSARHFTRGDLPKLTQVFTNLLKNAIKFTPEHGSITVRTSDVGNDRIRIDVIDTGKGVEPDFLPRMFNLYEQAEASDTREHGGLGLGLAICRGIVSAHQGSIAASSEGCDKGTTVSVELQIAASRKTLPCAAGVPSISTSTPPLKILLVDDHADTLWAMSRLLRRMQHSVTTASSVGNALAAAEENDFDLLISDVGLPDGTGLDLMRELLKKRPIKGIALTGYGMESDIAETRAAGFLAHLVKPIDFKQLETVIQRARL